MHKLYFTDGIGGQFIQDWDEVSEEPFNIASFEIEDSTPKIQYILAPGPTFMSYPDKLGVIVL
jgi:hypothetical protein